MTKKVKSFAESGTEDSDGFENSIEVDDPTEASATRRSQRASTRAMRGGDEEDRSESSNGRRKAKPRSRAPIPASRKSTRLTRRRSQDEDYEDDAEDDELDKEVAALHETTPEPVFSDHSSDNVGARTTTRGKKNNGRRRNIAHSTDDDQPIKRKLRERTNKVNYMIPLPLEEVPGRNRSGGGGSNLAGPSQHYGGFLMDMTRGAGALADPNMPNMPDSDSVSLSCESVIRNSPADPCVCAD